MNSSFESVGGAGMFSPVGRDAPLLSVASDGAHAGGGRLELLLGPMFSGKTTELTRRLRRAAVAGQKVLLLKWAGDDRYAAARPVVVTHDGAETKAKCVEKLADAHNVVWSYDVIGIDEGQFFDDLAEFAERWAEMGISVIVAALDGDFARRPFTNVTAAVPLADAVSKLTAVCHFCHGNAAFTMKEIGGKERYLPCCRTCHRQSFSEATSPTRRLANLDITQATRGSQARRNSHKGSRSPLNDLKGNTVPALVLR